MPLETNTSLDAFGLKPLLISADLQRLLRISRRTLDRLCHIGLLPQPMKLGGTNRWKPDDVNRAIEKLAPAPVPFINKGDCYQDVATFAEEAKQ